MESHGEKEMEHEMVTDFVEGLYVMYLSILQGPPTPELGPHSYHIVYTYIWLQSETKLVRTFPNEEDPNKDLNIL